MLATPLDCNGKTNVAAILKLSGILTRQRFFSSLITALAGFLTTTKTLEELVATAALLDELDLGWRVTSALDTGVAVEAGELAWDVAIGRRGAGRVAGLIARALLL